MSTQLHRPIGVLIANRPIRVLIADDQLLIRKMVRATLQQHPQIEVCGEVQNGAEAIEEALRLKPDVVILNVNMPVLNGFDAAREIRTKLPETGIVILSSNADHHFVEEAKKIGIRAYVDKTKAGEALVKAVEAAVKDEDFYVVQ
ncbi:MAG: response regulator [Candidatus Acidiferrales bacterium]